MKQKNLGCWLPEYIQSAPNNLWNWEDGDFKTVVLRDGTMNLPLFDAAKIYELVCNWDKSEFYIKTSTKQLVRVAW